MMCTAIVPLQIQYCYNATRSEIGMKRQVRTPSLGCVSQPNVPRLYYFPVETPTITLQSCAHPSCHRIHLVEGFHYHTVIFSFPHYISFRRNSALIVHFHFFQSFLASTQSCRYQNNILKRRCVDSYYTLAAGQKRAGQKRTRLLVETRLNQILTNAKKTLSSCIQGDRFLVTPGTILLTLYSPELILRRVSLQIVSKRFFADF
jgi:hypothetical protein